jgi:serine/threonine-protein kinase
VFEVGEADGTVFIAMEHVAGSTLRDVLRTGPLDAAEALRILREIARGVGQAHARGIVHRDLKPENVMVTREGQVKVLDFGLAKPIKTGDPTPDADDRGEAPDQDDADVDDAASKVGRILGTPAYMSPEQAAGTEVDARSDVFSIGVLAYEMLAGTRPFHGASRTELRRSIEHDAPRPLREVGVPKSLAMVVSRCLEKRPDDRLADGDALLAALEKVVLPRGKSVGRGAIIWVGLASLIVGGAWITARARGRPHTAQPSVSAAVAVTTAETPHEPPLPLGAPSAAVSLAPAPVTIVKSPPDPPVRPVAPASMRAKQASSAAPAHAEPSAPRPRAPSDPPAASAESTPSADERARALLGF